MKGTTLDGWRTLAEPTYAIGEFGKGRKLPAGASVELVRFNAVKSCPGAVTVLAVDPALDCPNPGTELWYVAASALRFEGERQQPYTVPPFSGVNYNRNAERCKGDETPCAICGRPIKNPAASVAAVVVDGGAAWGDEGSDISDAGYMGVAPIGSNCHRRFRLRVEGEG